MELYVVTSNYGQVMGVFSTEELAKSCSRHFSEKLPTQRFAIYLDFVDLIKY